MTARTSITSYDLLKTFATIIMVIDHIGMYFFPEEMWWRAVGRIGFPIWFFLVGYARGRDISPKLLIGAGLLIVGNILAGMTIFPLSALVTIILIRLILDPLMSVMLAGGRWRFWPIAVMLFIVVIPTMLVTEYGTQALITAIFGYLVRHRKEVGSERFIFAYMAFALITFVAMQAISFAFTPLHMAVVILGTFAVRSTLLFFRAEEFPKLTARLPGPLVGFLQFCGHRTLEIYVAHLLLFKVIALMLGMPAFGFMTWRWFQI